MPDSMNTTDIDIAAILDKAADYLDEYGWCRGHVYQPGDTSTHPRACAIGAIAYVTFGRPVDTLANGVPPKDSVHAAEARHTIGYLANRVDDLRWDDDTAPDEIVGDWNDSRPDATTVIDQLRAAARTHRSERA